MQAMRSSTIILLFGAAVLLASCAAQHPLSPFSAFYSNFVDCRQQYEELDARIDAAGVRDGAYYRVPGYPYLRTDRTLASFRGEVHGLEDVSELVRRMREFDQEARDYEYTNLGMSELEIATWREHFRNCGHILARIELADQLGWNRMIGRAMPVDEYSSLDRLVGLYPLRAPAMRRQLARKVVAEQNAYSAPLAAPQSGAALRLWRVKHVEDLSMIRSLDQRVLFDALGFPGLIGSEWRALAEYYAPQLWIETASESDLPAAPAFASGGLRADTLRPEIYYQYAFTRFGGRTMAQICYFVWFQSAPASAATPIDSFIWRVTLDESFAPLVYESMHGSGRNHRWYPVQALEMRAPDALSSEGEFVAPDLAPVEDVALRVASASHEVSRVVPAVQAADANRYEYQLHFYEDLYTLPRPEGGTRSLFGPDGIVAGTRGDDPLAKFPSGIAQAGALRQYGHHAIFYVGRRHFDDPWLLESTFVAPPPKPAPLHRLLTFAEGWRPR